MEYSLTLSPANSWSVQLIPGLRQHAKSLIKRQMFSHIVIFWTDPAETNAADEVVATAKKYLASVPGVVNFHVGKMRAAIAVSSIKVTR
jgi:hypothetical protein